jgi:hypothetical protein
MFTLFAATFWGTVTAIGVVVVAIIGAIIGWKVSDLFIPPQDHWTKSAVAIWTAKLVIAIGGGYFAVWAVATLITQVFG